MSKNYYDDYEEKCCIDDEQANVIADGLTEFVDVYLRFIVFNVEDSKIKKSLKRLKKMIPKIRDRNKRHKVFNNKMVKLIMGDNNDENRGLY